MDAREPFVILSSKPLNFRLLEIVGVLTVDLEKVLMREDAGVVFGVTRPKEGVTLPFEPDGVVRPLGMDVERDGVARPPREEATEDGRRDAPMPTVGADNLVVATKTPQLGGHEKYGLL